MRLAVPVGGEVRSRLTSRDGVCAHLQLVRRSLPAGRRRGAGQPRGPRPARPGTRRPASRCVGGDPADGGVRRPVTVVGLYDAVDARTPYWAGRSQAPIVAAAEPGRQLVVRTVDELITPWATLAAEPWPDLRTHLDVPLLAGPAGPRPAAPRCRQPPRTSTPRPAPWAARRSARSARCWTRPPPARPGAHRDPAARGPARGAGHRGAGVRLRRRDRAAPAGDRAGPAARARHPRRRAACCCASSACSCWPGGVLGAALGWLVAVGAGRAGGWSRGSGRRPGGRCRPPSSRRCVAGLLAIVAAGSPTLRQPLTSLLRRVPPRASTLQVGLVEGAVVAAAAAGVVTLLTGDGGGDRPARARAAGHRRWAAAGAGHHPHRRPAGRGRPARRPAALGAGRAADRPPAGAAPADRHHHGGLRAAGLRRRRLDGGRPQPRDPRRGRGRRAGRARRRRRQLARRCATALLDIDPKRPLRHPGRDGVVGDRGRPAHHRGRAGGVRPDRAVGRPRPRRPRPRCLVTPPRPTRSGCRAPRSRWTRRFTAAAAPRELDVPGARPGGPMRLFLGVATRAA